MENSTSTATPLNSTFDTPTPPFTVTVATTNNTIDKKTFSAADYNNNVTTSTPPKTTRTNPKTSSASGSGRSRRNETSEQPTIPPLLVSTVQSITRVHFNINPPTYRHPRIRAHRTQNRGGAGLPGGTNIHTAAPAGLDQQMIGAIVIGSIFLFVSLFLTVAVIVFCKKKNTVFVFQKSEQQEYNDADAEEEDEDEDWSDDDTLSCASTMQQSAPHVGYGPDETGSTPQRLIKPAGHHEGYRRMRKTQQLSQDSAWLARPWLHSNVSSCPNNHNHRPPPTTIQVVLHCQNDSRDVNLLLNRETITTTPRSRSNSDDRTSLVSHSMVANDNNDEDDDERGYYACEAADTVPMEMTSLGAAAAAAVSGGSRRGSHHPLRRMTGSVSVDKFPNALLLLSSGGQMVPGGLRKSQSYHQTFATHQV